VFSLVEVCPFRLLRQYAIRNLNISNFSDHFFIKLNHSYNQEERFWASWKNSGIAFSDQLTDVRCINRLTVKALFKDASRHSLTLSTPITMCSCWSSWWVTWSWSHVT